MNKRTRNYDRTRILLLDAASHLFAIQGYDETAVESIIERAGVSKGAFYHHFNSKEAILEATTDRLVGEGLDAIRTAVAAGSSGALDRLNRFLEASRGWRLSRLGLLKEVFSVLLRDENSIMRRKMEARSTQLSLPLLEEILRQGAEEGVFNPPDFRETAAIILSLSYAVGEAQTRAMLRRQVLPDLLTELEHRAEVFTQILERTLAVPRGSVGRPDFRQILQQA
jgi:AcrR family transcriptional regulator